MSLAIANTSALKPDFGRHCVTRERRSSLLHTRACHRLHRMETQAGAPQVCHLQGPSLVALPKRINNHLFSGPLRSKPGSFHKVAITVPGTDKHSADLTCYPVLGSTQHPRH